MEFSLGGIFVGGIFVGGIFVGGIFVGPKILRVRLKLKRNNYVIYQVSVTCKHFCPVV